MRRVGEERVEIGAQPQNSGKPRMFKFVVGTFIALFIFISAVILWQAYNIWRVQNKAALMVQSWQDYQNKQYQLALADTYGGKTPQETLQMYIEAVQKGDYELASKYFILDYQNRWFTSLQEIQKANKIEFYLAPLKEALNSQGEYSASQTEYAIYNPVSVDFKLYPSGIWKIVEI